ncbi:MAG: dihydrolipoyl dehydrogenase [Gammaproteobacteria bacterium]|nr:dihydrolipoyl dehydrogenase [Gammaproteobacteria bacterium]
MANNINTIDTDLVVLGSGPGGYSAAFRAADLGINTVLVERYPTLGGVCLNVGCIPSKALLHTAKVLDETAHLSNQGVDFGKPKVDIRKLHNWVSKDVVGKLTTGLKMMASKRKVQVVEGVGSFASPNSLVVGDTTINFKNAIIAAGSSPVKLPFLPQDPRIIDSTGALKLEDIPEKMLVIGGGIIGLEMATVYSTLGSKVTIVEMLEGLMGGLDKDLVRPLQKTLEKKLEKIYLNTKVTKVEAKPDGLWVTMEAMESMEGKDAGAPTESVKYDRILVSTGRVPNGKTLGAEKAGVKVDERGFIAVDNQQRTNVAHIYAIGDIVGNPMLAHKAIPEGRLAAEVIAGKKHFFEAKVIPSVAYTDPEVAWVGIMESEAKEQGLEYGVGKFPWAASGRSLAQGRNEGLTKLIFDKNTHRLLGAGIVGPGAGELIAEATLAIEMGCDAEDIALTIHPHPTVSETIALATEVFEGTVTDLYLGR